VRPAAVVDPERLAALALSFVSGIGPARFRELRRAHPTARAALAAAAAPALAERAIDRARSAVAAAHAAGAGVAESGDAEYPASLDDLDDPPPHLWYLGDPSIVGASAPPAVAIVGTRRTTAYGERVTAELATALARAGATIVSGMALGIDAAAHRAALQAGGRTVAVLGTGVDVPYPAAHRTLHTEIARTGLVVSEQPVGARAGPGAFPRRNRIIAALASATIVVEAGARSGALITASHALDLGRTVAAVPGPIDVPQAAGSNELVRDGAVVIASVADALALLGLHGPPARRGPTFDGDERIVWDALSVPAPDLDVLTARTALPTRVCLAALTNLELAGAVECSLTGEVRRR
jgi:DNA processing protein